MTTVVKNEKSHRNPERTKKTILRKAKHHTCMIGIGAKQGKKGSLHSGGYAWALVSPLTVTHVIKQSNKGIKNMILSVFPAIDEVPAIIMRAKKKKDREKKFVDKVYAVPCTRRPP